MGRLLLIYIMRFSIVNEYSSEFELMRIPVFPSIQIKTYGICNIWIADCIRFPPVVIISCTAL